MIRFKVVKASRLLLGLAIAVLAAVLCLIALRVTQDGKAGSQSASASLVSNRTHEEAEAQPAFASNRTWDGAGIDKSTDTPSIEIEVIQEVEEPEDTLIESPKPSVLIYHTHTHEAYRQVEDDPYEAVEAWRTEDAAHSVVRVGEALAEALRSHGFEVVHDDTDHEKEPLSTAYTRSLATLERYERDFDLYIDLHRDAYIDGMDMCYTDETGVRYAQPMLLIGNGNGFDVKPWYEQNLAFAKVLTDRLNALKPGLCKDVLVKDGRYNQHIGIFSILIEVGHNMNTLEEALNTTPIIANAIDDMLIENPDPELKAMRAAAVQN